MKTSPLAGLAAAVALGAHAQQVSPYPPSATALAFQPLDSIVVTATRSPQRTVDALRDVEVITRDDIDRAGSISLAELLQRQALVEFRGTGGAGQPAGIFLRGANAGHTLVLVDGLRASSATVGTTSIENIPLDLIERIEVVKGPLSSLYGPDAIGGVVQIFTRASLKPRLFAAAGYGTDSDSRLSAGFTAIEGKTTVSFSAGWRSVDAPSATNERAFCHDPDRDPYDNAFANLQVLGRLAPGETLAFSGFTSRGRARFDGCPDAQGRFANDRNVQTLSGASVTSAMAYASWWTSRITVGQGRDELSIEGFDPARFETRQDQASWVHEFRTPAGKLLAGVETLRQKVLSATAFAQTRRDTNSVWAGLDESWRGYSLEASARRDDDDQFGARNTGAVSGGLAWPGVGVFSATIGRGFRAPTFFDLYAPSSDFYVANPDLRPERSRSREVALRSEPVAGWQLRLTGFDNRIEDLITYVFPTVLNVRRARIRGLEASAQGTVWGTTVRASLAAQRPRDEDTGFLLQGRAKRFGRLEASRAFGAWSVSGGVTASGERFDSATESADLRLPGYAIADATVRYAAGKGWTVEVVASNLLDRRYEHVVGYDAPRRGVLLNFRFEAP
ncbi:MAG TPA: TonB-dependent receptor [Usitatibacteraceae bacterium]|nr:TonB-dependent receptor [Usitatibacteraceae bacterium]